MDKWVDIIVNCLLSTVNLLPRCQRLSHGTGRAVSEQVGTRRPTCVPIAIGTTVGRPDEKFIDILEKE